MKWEPRKVAYSVSCCGDAIPWFLAPFWVWKAALLCCFVSCSVLCCLAGIYIPFGVTSNPVWGKGRTASQSLWDHSVLVKHGLVCVKHRLISYTLRPVLFVWPNVAAALTIYVPERGIYGFINVLHNLTCRNKKLVSSRLFLPGIIQSLKKNPVFKNVVSSIWAESSPFPVLHAIILAPGKQRSSGLQGHHLQHNQVWHQHRLPEIPSPKKGLYF